MVFSFRKLVVVAALGVASVQGREESSAGTDGVSFLQQQPVVIPEEATVDASGSVAVEAQKPYLINLRRESVPVIRQGKVAAFKTSYSGVLNVGTPAQEFRVVFDTGSGNIVLPATECKSEACLMPHRHRFNMSASSTAEPVNKEGNPVDSSEPADTVTIGFGTGEITGELAMENVCFGEKHEQTMSQVAVSTTDAETTQTETDSSDLCVRMNVILAIEMSSQPFKSFQFDGIMGLGLPATAVGRSFSAFNMLSEMVLPKEYFGIFLSEGEEEGEDSQIAFGGWDEKRFLEPLQFAPVIIPEFGYWMVHIQAVRVNGVELDICKDGQCRGVVDTGTSHLGIPAPADGEVSQLLTREAGDTLDCRLIDAPEMEIQLKGLTLKLTPGNYMRRLPLREGVSVGSSQGVHVPSAETNKTLNASSAADPVGNSSSNSNGTTASGDDDASARRFCSPRIVPVRLPAPVGPKLFILGEPVLHRYYTVYDWRNRQVGFSLANTKRNTQDSSQLTDRKGALPEEVDMLLMQERMTVSRQSDRVIGSDDTIVAMVQVSVQVSVKRRNRRL